MTRKFPEFTKFLASVLGADEAHVRHCIRRCREADLLPRGKPGGGSPVVTSEDAAKSFLVVLAADRPIDAPASLALLTSAVPQKKRLGVHERGDELDLPRRSEMRDVPELAKMWSERTLVSTLGTFIDFRREDPGFELTMDVRVERGTIPLAWVRWFVFTSSHPQGRWAEIFFCADLETVKGMGISQTSGGADSPIHIEVKCDGRYLQKIADWLEGGEAD